MYKRRLAAAVTATFAGVVMVATPAFAHVTVNPTSEPKGAYAELTLRVPNEKDATTTTQLEVDIPTDNPIASVSVQPHPGWTYTVEKSTLANPITTDDGQVTEAVSKIVWTANAGGGLKPGEYDDFNISAGPLPTNVDQIALKALQTYSDGTVVRWIDPTVAGQPEPDHPAPVLHLTAAQNDSAMQTATTANPNATGSTNSANTANTAAFAKKSQVNSARTIGIVGIVIGALGLLAALAALGALVRKRA